MRQAFADTMLSVGQEDARLVVMVGDISHGILKPFAAACPARYFNIGICEQAIVGMAAGMAKTGLLPVVHTIAPFLIERSFEQIKLDFSYQKLGGTLVSVGAAFDYAGLGCSHHCYGDFALLKTLPGVQIIAPGSRAEFDALFRQTYANGRLTYFRLSEPHGVTLPSVPEVGKGVIVKEGTGKTIICTGAQLRTVMDALPLLPENTEVIYFPTVKPFDADLIRHCYSLLVIEEHSTFGGLADDARRVCRRVASIAIPDEWQRGYGSRAEHLQACGFTPENIRYQLSAL